MGVSQKDKNTNKQKIKQTFEDRVLKIACFTADDFKECELDSSVKDRLFKYSGEEFVEEFSIDLEDSLLMIFYKLALISNYKDIHAQLNLIKADKSNTGLRAQKILADDPKFEVIKKIVREYESDWCLFLMSEHESLFKVLNGDEILPENISPRQIGDIKLRVSNTNPPSYDQIMGCENLIDFTVDCFDRALEMAVSSFFSYRLLQRDLAWSALSKAKEFLGIYQGARARLSEEGAQYIKSSLGGRSNIRKLEFIRDCMKLKMRKLSREYRGGFDIAFENKFGEKINEEEREVEFEHKLIDEVLLPIYIQGTTLLDISKLSVQKMDDLREQCKARFEEWLKLDDELQLAYLDFKDKVLADRELIVEQVFQEALVAEDKVGETADNIVISRKEWNQLIYAFTDHWKAYDCRHLDCPKGNDCPLRVRENIRREDAIRFLNNPFLSVTD